MTSKITQGVQQVLNYFTPKRGQKIGPQTHVAAAVATVGLAFFDLSSAIKFGVGYSAIATAWNYAIPHAALPNQPSRLLAAPIAAPIVQEEENKADANENLWSRATTALEDQVTTLETSLRNGGDSAMQISIIHSYLSDVLPSLKEAFDIELRMDPHMSPQEKTTRSESYNRYYTQIVIQLEKQIEAISMAWATE